jgi:DNA-binding transcriptional MerR regulator
MVVYSITDLEQLSGVKAHTLRIWEKRYSILNPKRTKTNIRYYLDEDLKHLLNIALLNKHGIKISKIAEMSSGQIQKKVAEITEIDESFEGQIDSLTISVLELDDEKCTKIIDKKIEELGFTKTMTDVIYPLLDKTAMMWLTGSIKAIHEKFISSLIRRKCIAEIDKLPHSDRNSFLIYLPKGETNELSLLFLHYLIREQGHKVISAGSDVDIYDLMEAKDFCSPDFIFTILNEISITDDMKKQMQMLCEVYPESKLILSGIQTMNTDISQENGNCILLHTFAETIQFLENL